MQYKIVKLLTISLMILLLGCSKETQDTLRLGLYLSKRDVELANYIRQDLAGWGWRNSFDLIFLECCNQTDMSDIDFALLAYYEEEFDDRKKEFNERLGEKVPHVLWILKPGFFAQPQLPAHLDAIASASAERPSEKALKNLVKPRLEKIAAEMREKRSNTIGDLEGRSS